MLFALICTDKPGSLETRMANREAHLAYIKSTECVTQAGPFLDQDDQMCGSLVVLECETLEAAQSWADNDPYALAGLFSDVRIEKWKRVIG